MLGRDEKDNAINNKVLIGLRERPGYLTEFYYYLADKTATTKRNYIGKVLKFIDAMQESGIIDINDPHSFKNVRAALVSQYIEMLNCKDSSKCQTYYAIKDFFDFLLINDFIDKNPTDKIKAHRVRDLNEITVVTKEEIEIIINNIKDPYSCKRIKDCAQRKTLMNENLLLVSLALQTGMRRGSIAEINISDIDFTNKSIDIVQKGNRHHVVYFSNSLEEMIMRWLQDREKIIASNHSNTDALFVNEKGDRISDNYFYKMMEWATKGIDKHITPHKLRSTFATMVYDETGDIYLTAELLGHHGVQNTVRYAKIKDAKKRNAAEMMGSWLSN